MPAAHAAQELAADEEVHQLGARGLVAAERGLERCHRGGALDLLRRRARARRHRRRGRQAAQRIDGELHDGVLVR